MLPAKLNRIFLGVAMLAAAGWHSAAYAEPTMEGLSAGGSGEASRVAELEAKVARLEAALEGNLGTVRDQAGLTRDLALEQVKERAWGKLLSDLEKATSVSQKTFSAEIRENRWTSGHHAVCHFDVSYRPREWRLEFMTAHPLIPFYVEHYDGDEKFEVRKVKVDLTPAEASVLAQGAGKK